MNIIFIAPSGAGKGTFSKYLTEKFNFKHITTGHLIRKEIDSKSKLGNNLKKIVENGGFASDEIIKELVKKEMIKLNKENIVFDGYPRNMKQVKDYESIKKELGIKDEIVINISIDKSVAMNRTLGRMVCPMCGRSYNNFNDLLKPIFDSKCDGCKCELKSRADDNEKTFNKRFEVYINQTAPIVDYFKTKKEVVEINNNGNDIEKSLIKIEEAIKHGDY